MPIIETVTLETVTTVEHRCEALTIGDIPPYRCTTSATADRQGPGFHRKRPKPKNWSMSSGRSKGA
jgi:hypothetical protein